MAATRLPKAAAVGSIGCPAGGEDGTIPAADELSSAVVVVGGGLVVVVGGSVVTGMPDVGGTEVVGAEDDMVSDTRLLRHGRGPRR